jgi:hypothetical protein
VCFPLLLLLLLLQVWGAVKLLNAMGMYGTARQLHYGYLGEEMHLIRTPALVVLMRCTLHTVSVVT